MSNSRGQFACKRGDGRQKVRFRNVTEAAIAAARRTSETGLLYEGYSCPSCHRHHIGKSRFAPSTTKARTFEVDVPELGERVFWCMWVENGHNVGVRYKTIAARLRRQGREAVSSRGAA